MPESRLVHHHHPSHSSHPSQPPYPSPYPSQSGHPSYHHSSSRHVSNGPPQQVVGGGPQHSMPMGGPPEPVGPPPQSLGNGHSHQHPPSGPPMSAAARAGKEKQDNVLSQLASANENTWMLIGAVAEQMQDQDRAMMAFENALRHNPNSILGLNAVASIARSRDQFDKAIEYFQRILNIKQDNGEVWGSMGHCLLMKDDLPKAYTAYQQALYHLPNPKEPKLWYGIGILYDRYGSFEHAEEAFSSVLKMDPTFEKANEIYFRLGIIYKHQRKYQASLDCFKYILQNPPRPLTSWDIWFQLGHVYEQDRDYENARDAYMRVLTHQPDHAKVLQQLGWLHHQPGAPFADQEKAVSYLTKSLETGKLLSSRERNNTNHGRRVDGSDAQSWYLLGRAFMAGQRYNKAYEAYQQAVYRDGRNPTFWCSIGVLYYQINQYRDALDAYSRAIRLNPYISEVWYNLGSLYESCNNQINDAIDAYTRAVELDPTNGSIKQRLSMLQNAGGNVASLPPAPAPVDVHPSQYTAQPQGAYPPGASPGGSPRAVQMLPGGIDPGLEPQNGRALPPPPPGGDMGRGHSPGPFRGGAAPPPLQHVDESRGSMARHAPLAPMDVDRVERDVRGGGDPYRDAPPSQRYDPAVEHPSRRHAESPSSPRRRAQEAYPPYPPYPPYGGRDREREEWERSNRERASRGPPGPSPRLHDRAPQPPLAADIRRQPSPRNPPDYRGEYYHPADPRQPYPYDRRYDERREPTPSSNAANGLHPSAPPYDDPRAPSPAASSISVGSKRRKEESTEPRSAKKERSVSKKTSGDKKTSLKVTLRTTGVAAGEAEEVSPKNKSVASSPTPSAPAAPIPSRTVDEDYDEGAADALMTLHGDIPPSRSEEASTPAPATGSKRPASPNSPPNSKKARPEAINRLSTGGSAVNANPAHPPEGVSPKPSPAKSRTQIIEVLNTPSISSPVPRPESANPEGKAEIKENGLEVEGETVEEKEDVPAPLEAVVVDKETEQKNGEAAEKSLVNGDDAVDPAAAEQPATEEKENGSAGEQVNGDKDIVMEDAAAPATAGSPAEAELVAPAPVKSDKVEGEVEVEGKGQAADATGKEDEDENETEVVGDALRNGNGNGETAVEAAA